MNVLVACEYSGRVREAFRNLGHDAWSNDILPADDDSPYHIQGDCIGAIKSRQWDIIIMHPPCTALTVAGNSTYGEGQPKYAARLQSVKWTVELWETAKRYARVGVCMENPVGVLPRLGGIKAAQYVQPYMFGHTEQKKTGLWLDRLPDLIETNNVYEEMMRLPKRERERLHYLPPSPDRWKIRSTTYQGIADAMAAQWGGLGQLWTEADEARMDVIGTNGNDGLHYTGSTTNAEKMGYDSGDDSNEESNKNDTNNRAN